MLHQLPHQIETVRKVLRYFHGRVLLECPENTEITEELNVQRRNAEKRIGVYWNAIKKELEPLACSKCAAASFTMHFDDQLNTLCAACAKV